jgi:hypothetical protein
MTAESFVIEESVLPNGGMVASFLKKLPNAPSYAVNENEDVLASEINESCEKAYNKYTALASARG